MMKRQPDGRWRNARKAVVVSEAILKARWIEAETIHLKRMGLSFDAIAEQITRVGRHQAQAIVTISDGVEFPPDFQISRQACHKAFKKAVAREPSLAAEEFRKVDTARCEEMFLNVMAGNPTIPSGPFFDAFSRERGLWKCLSIDAFDSPNLKGLDLEQLLAMDRVDGGPLDNNPFPQLVTRRWVFEQYLAWWHGNEGSSPNWLSRVLARFPDQAQNALFRMRWLERARQRALQKGTTAGSGSLVAGVDVGGGEAETVVYVAESNGDCWKIIRMGAWRGEDTRGQVVGFLNEFRTRLSLVRVDSIGIGHNFGLHLRDCRFQVELVKVGMPCPTKPHMGDNDPARRFVNLRACFYQALADAFERDQVEGLIDEETIGQLSGILYELDSQGRIRIEAKDKARARGVPSPDRADALMLAIAAADPGRYPEPNIFFGSDDDD
jgi:hypothetical protein